MNGGPNGGMRSIYRRTFYVLITVALITVYIQVGKISNVSTVLRKQLNETEGELASERTALQHSNRHLKHAVAGNVLLMALNVLIAYRGVQIWSMLQRVGFEGWIQTIQANSPWVRRIGKVGGAATLPFRQAVRPFNAPFAWWNAKKIAAAEAEAAAAAAAAAAKKGIVSGLISRGVKDTIAVTKWSENVAKGVFMKGWRFAEGTLSLVVN